MIAGLFEPPAALLAWFYSFTHNYIIAISMIALVTPLRTEPRDEGLGLDFTQHGEEAYARGEGAILVLNEPPSPASPHAA